MARNDTYSPTESSSSDSGPIVLFDGVCNLCNASVQWVIERDTKGRFRFASLQWAAAKRVLQRADEGVRIETLPDSIVLVDGDKLYTRSTAAIRIARQLRFPYSLFGVFMAVPRPIRDALYNFVARNRYRWFGRRDTCMMPTPDLASRFLVADETRSPSP